MSYSKINEDVLKSLGPETQFAKDIEKMWGVELRKDVMMGRQDFSEIDYMIIQPNTDEVLGYIELKNRTISSTMYKTLMINHKKMIALRTQHTYSKKPVFLGLRYTDLDLYYEVNLGHSFKIEHNGRTLNTRSKYDIRQVEHLPLKHFRKIKKRGN